MRKVFKILMPALALGLIIGPRVFAASENAKLPANVNSSVEVIRKVVNVGGRVRADFNYELTPSADNPAAVENLPAAATVNMDAIPDRNMVAWSGVSIDFSNVSFSKVGDYTFTVREVGVSDAVNLNQSEDAFDVYFQVTNSLDDDGKPTGELNVEMMNFLLNHKTGEKTSSIVAEFEATANYSYIQITNDVMGSAADVDKYFAYLVRFTDIGADSNVTIMGQDETIELDGATFSPRTRWYGGASFDLIVYLKHGQTATIGKKINGAIETNELRQGLEYTVERLYGDDGYSTTIDGAVASSTQKTAVAESADDFNSSNITHIVNERNATVKTGVFATTWPFLLLAAFGVSGFVIFRRIARS